MKQLAAYAVLPGGEGHGATEGIRAFRVDLVRRHLGRRECWSRAGLNVVEPTVQRYMGREGWFKENVAEAVAVQKTMESMIGLDSLRVRQAPRNVGSHFGYIDEAQYVSGIVAGVTTKTSKFRFIVAKLIRCRHSALPSRTSSNRKQTT